jgi:type IV fimbrial biogenesis protein FimT
MFNQTNFGETSRWIDQNGFTLIELLVSLTLLAGLLLCSLQSYQPIQITTESRTVLTQLINVMRYARSEAIRSGNMVTLCKSRDGKTCGGTWSDGQIAFIKGWNTRILIALGPIKRGKLRLQAFQSADFLRFTPKGTTLEQNGTFIYCPTENPHLAHALIIEKSGQVRISRDEDHDGIDEDAEGIPLFCSAD